jgi:hypothetical protein
MWHVPFFSSKEKYIKSIFEKYTHFSVFTTKEGI